MTWLLAGLIAGVLSGLVSWIISLFYPALYVGGLVNEVTTFAAFTALLIFLPAIIAVGLGRWMVDRNAPRADRKPKGDGERADTDVFAAVRDDRADPVDHDPWLARPKNPSGADRSARDVHRSDQTARGDTTSRRTVSTPSVFGGRPQRRISE